MGLTKKYKHETFSSCLLPNARSKTVI